MELKLKRRFKGPNYTIGSLYVNGIYECDTLEDTDRGLDNNMPLSVIQTKKVYGKTAIPTGTYGIDMNIISPKFKDRSWARFCNGKLPRLRDVRGFEGVLIHCLTEDMEILTENGWQNLKNYNENTPQKCYSYNCRTEEIELVDIDNFISREHHGIIYENVGKRINYSVTGEHDMLCKIRGRNGYNEKFVKANELPKCDAKFRTSGRKQGEEITEEQLLLYRLIMAVQADGYIINWSKNSSQVKFHLKKERKIERLQYMLKKLNVKYRLNVNTDNTISISLEPDISNYISEIMNPFRDIRNTKELPLELLMFPSNILKELVHEYLFWDGRYENYLKCNKNLTISSTNINTLNLLQAMCTLCGYRSYIKDEDGCKALVFYENQEEVIPERYTYKTRKYDGGIWCLKNRNNTLIVRKNNRPMIIGNCGNKPEDTLGCLLVGQNKLKGQVINSTEIFTKLYNKMDAAHKRGEPINITIE